MYPDSGYKRAHAQSVCTRPFSRVGRGLETRLIIVVQACNSSKFTSRPLPMIFLPACRGQCIKGIVSLYKGRVLLFLKTFEINRKT